MSSIDQLLDDKEKRRNNLWPNEINKLISAARVLAQACENIMAEGEDSAETIEAQYALSKAKDILK